MSRLSRSSAVVAIFVAFGICESAGAVAGQHIEHAVCPELRVAPSIDTLRIRCARVTVPQARGDRASPHLAPVRLSVVIFSRSETNWKATPVLYLTGGPGESAIDDVAGSFLATPTGWALVRERPVIAFDQRGFGTQTRDADPWIGGLRRARGDTVPLHPDQLQSLLTSAAAGLRRQGVDLRNFDTVESAADAVDVLRALGVRRAILYGTSYGTRVALHILGDNEELVEAAVLDGVVPPQATGAFQLDSANEYRRQALHRLVEDCHADARCRRTHPTILEDFRTLMRPGTRMSVNVRNARTGAVAPATVTGLDVAAAIGGYLIMEEFRVAAPGILAELQRESLTVDSQSGIMAVALRLGGRVAAIPEYGLAYLSVICAESPNGIEQYGGTTMCNALGVPFAGRRHVAPVTSSVPTLLIGSRYDASSPPEWANLAARTLRRGHVVIMPGTGHVATSQAHSADCVREVVLEFVHASAHAPAAHCVATLGRPRFRDAALRAGGHP